MCDSDTFEFTFQSNNKNLQQTKKGIIGLDLMRALAKLYMIDWTAKFKEKLIQIQKNSDTDLNLKLILEAYSIYVDDQSSIQKPTPIGAKFDPKENKIVINKEQAEKDQHMKNDRRTANVMVDIANSIDPSIKMEASVPSDFSNNKMPLLNSQVWIENDTINGPQIRYEHYEKSMASQLEIQNASATPDQIKRATLVQGGTTRLLNTSLELGKDKQKEVLRNYMKKLQTSGYDLMYRLTILKSILKGWQKILEKSETGERPLHRPREFEKDKRMTEKSEKKLNWYKGKHNQFESVMMVPATPMGELKQMIQEKATNANLKVKVVEKAGLKLSAYLKKYEKSSNNKRCKEKDCMICTTTTKTNSKSKCRTPNILYKITCKECEKGGQKAHY